MIVIDMLKWGFLPIRSARFTSNKYIFPNFIGAANQFFDALEKFDIISCSTVNT